MTFEQQVEQEEAKRLLRAALAEGPAHAYLFSGPRGVGKRAVAAAFAAELLGDEERVARGTHPDLYVLEPLGDQIRIDAIRALRHDLHMRPFEADRRVYLIVGADLMNEDAADALLKDLEEPPDYAVIVLLAADLARLPETIRSRCQLVPFTRLSPRALAMHAAALRLDLSPDECAVLARIAGGRLDRVERLLDPETAGRRIALIQVARAVYTEPRFDPSEASRSVADAARQAGARAAAEDEEGAEGTARELEQRARRVSRGAEREEIVEALDHLAGWYRDLLVAGTGATGAVLNTDLMQDVVADASRIGQYELELAVESVLDTRRSFELNVAAGLALEALFLRLRRELSRFVPAAAGAGV